LPAVFLTTANRNVGVGDVVSAMLSTGPRHGHFDDAADVRQAVLEAGRRALERALDRAPHQLAALMRGETVIDDVVRQLFAQEGIA
jgi:hypothetical protein